MFTKFPSLPPELRNKIWATASNNQPRTIDLWTDFERCSVGNSIFYTQIYEVELAKPPLSPLLQTSRESRIEALKHYTLEFRTHMTIGNGVSVVIAPKIYVNYACDTLVPRGFWNVVSFADFTSRVQGQLVHLAVDVEGSFWRENLRDYCAKGCWALNGVEELVLYDSREEKMWKGSDYLEKFRKKYTGGPKMLKFEECEEKSRSLLDMEKFLERLFDKVEGKEKDEEGEQEETLVRIPRYLDDCEPTEADELRRPNMMLRKLVARDPIAA